MGRPCLAMIAALSAMGANLPAPAWAQAATDAMLQLPKEEIPGRQIGWRDDSLKAFTEAVENSKPLVVVFGSKDSSYTQRLAREVLTCPQFARLAGLAVFTYGAPNEDEYARRMALHLKLTDYPTISVIAPRTDQLTETYRMEGFFHAEDIVNDLLEAILTKDKPRPPKTVPPPYGYVGKSCDDVSKARMDGKFPSLQP